MATWYDILNSFVSGVTGNTGSTDESRIRMLTNQDLYRLGRLAQVAISGDLLAPQLGPNRWRLSAANAGILYPTIATAIRYNSGSPATWRSGTSLAEHSDQQIRYTLNSTGVTGNPVHNADKRSHSGCFALCGT